jgi:hypothetical protein
MTESADDRPQLASLRRDVEAANDLPVAERLTAFDAVNVALVHELAQLDEL